MKISNLIAATAVALGCAVSSQAIALNYEIGTGSSVTAHTSGPGLLVTTTLVGGLANVAFTIDDGQSSTFNFFRIAANESDVGADDTVPRSITAYLDFDAPDVTAEIGGDTFGRRVGFLGLTHQGRVEWDGPQLVSVGDRTFSVSLNDATFGSGFLGLSSDRGLIRATVTQVSSRDVPEAGSTLVLLGMGVTAMAFARRRATA